jgi:uncharacterized protein YndB with AHSA1/START domain
MATVAITADQDAVVGEIFIAAPPSRVFEAITDPNQMPLWWGQKGLYRITEWKADLRVGGKWSSDGMGADGKSFRVEGEYLEIDPPRLLVHTWLPSWAHPVKTVVRWELEPQSVHGLHPNGPRKAGTGTLVRVRQEGFAGNIAVATGHSEGWTRVLGWLHRFAEKGETVDTRG